MYLSGIKTVKMAREVLETLAADKDAVKLDAAFPDKYPTALHNTHFFLIGGNHSVAAQKQALASKPHEPTFQTREVDVFINLDQAEMEKVSW